MGSSKEGAALDGSYADGELVLDALDLQPDASVPDAFVLSSGPGANKISIEIEGKQLAEGNRGLNFVVYQRKTGILVDTSSFDTHVGLSRTSDIVQ